MKQENVKRDLSPIDEKHLRLSGSQVVEEQQSDPFTSLHETLAEVKRKAQREVETSQDRNEPLDAEPKHQRNFPLPRQSAQETQNRQESIVSKLKGKITELRQTGTECQKVIDSLKERNAELVQENNALKARLDRRTDAMPRNPEQVFRDAANCVLQMISKQQEKAKKETLPDPIQLYKVIEAELNRFKEQFDGQAVHILSPVQTHLAKAKELTQFELSELSPLERDWENQPEQLAELALTDGSQNEVQFPYLGELGKIYWDDLKVYASKIPPATVKIQSILYQIVVLLVDGFSPYGLRKTVDADVFGTFYQNHLPNILQAADLEFVPIEIGQTQADARIHDIQGTQPGPFNLGVVADIVQQGLRRCSDQKIIRKPVVIRGEPE